MSLIEFFTALTLPSFEVGVTETVVEIPSPKKMVVRKPVFRFENPLEEYAMDILSHSKAEEEKYRVSPAYLHHQKDLTVAMRAVLINWMYEVAEYFRLLPETFALTVQTIDRFLNAKTEVYLACQAAARKPSKKSSKTASVQKPLPTQGQIPRTSLQLIGCASMLIASKVEETYALPVADLVAISNDAFLPQQLLAMEKSIMVALGWNITVPTSLYFLKNAYGLEDLITKNLATYLVELSCADYKTLEFSSSAVAAGALYLARRLMHRQRVGYECAEYAAKFVWPEEFVTKTGCDEANTKLAANHLNQTLVDRFLDSAHAGSPAVTIKWTDYRQSCVGRVQPLKSF